MLQILFMKKGGKLIYAGTLGSNSHKLIDFFEVCWSLLLSIKHPFTFFSTTDGEHESDTPYLFFTGH